MHGYFPSIQRIVRTQTITTAIPLCRVNNIRQLYCRLLLHLIVAYILISLLYTVPTWSPRTDADTMCSNDGIYLKLTVPQFRTNTKSRNMDTEMTTTIPLVSLPDAIFSNILEYLDWSDVSRLDTAFLNSITVLGLFVSK